MVAVTQETRAGRQFEIPGQAVVRKWGIWQDGWQGACQLLWRAGPKITWRRERKGMKRREMTTVFVTEKFAGLPSGTWRTKERQPPPSLRLSEGDSEVINLDSSEATHLPTTGSQLP